MVVACERVGNLRFVMAHLAVVDPLESAGPMMVWLVVLTFVYAECALVVGMFLPGDSLLLAAGVVLAEHGHEFDAWALSACAVIVAVCGNHTGYAIGAHTGTWLLARRDGRVLNRRNLDRAGWFFERWGFWAVVTARWLPWIRTLAPMLAGATAMDRRKFFLASLVGAVGWVPLLVLIGYYGARLLDHHSWLKPLAAGMAIGMFVVGTGYGLWRYRQEMSKPVDDDATLVSALRQRRQRDAEDPNEVPGRAAR
jgi:membrane-associated protein